MLAARGGGGASVVRTFSYFSRWLVLVAATMSLISASGCAMFNSENWDLDFLRDPRAVDIDNRLEDGNRPIVVNPF
jgi:hypothetical protein